MLTEFKFGLPFKDYGRIWEAFWTRFSLAERQRRHALAVTSLTLPIVSLGLSKFLFGLWTFHIWAPINCFSHLKTYLNLKQVNFVVCELFLRLFLFKKPEKQKNFPWTYLKAFSVILGSSFVVMLDVEEQIVIYLRFRVIWLVRITSLSYFLYNLSLYINGG